ncbi:MAG: hypothetical protein R3231_09410, partial [bacterium]|nr:hypothetical protein [bacterium]
MQQLRQKGVCRAFLSILILLVIMWEASLAEESGHIHLSLGTATKGGGFELFGRHVAQVINAQDPTLRVETIATGGSRQNLKFLEGGRIDLG